MKVRFKMVIIALISCIFSNQPLMALEKPVVESFTASKLEVDITDLNLSIDFEVVISHPKGLENHSTLLYLTNSTATSISVPLLRTDTPIDYSKNKVTYRGTITLPRNLAPGVYNYYIDGVKNNNDNGKRFPTGAVDGPKVRELKGAETGILVRSNGNLNLDYETINGPAFGSQSGISYSNPAKFSGVPEQIWKVGELFDPLNYFEVSVNKTELLITSLTPQVCASEGKIMKLVAEGECHYKVYTKRTSDYIEKSKTLFATVTGARTPQILKIETLAPLKPIMLPTSITLPYVYASGLVAVNYVMPESITPLICEVGGYVLTIVKVGICTLTYQSSGNSQYLSSEKNTQMIEILGDNLPSSNPTPSPVASPTPVPTKSSTKTIQCVKGKVVSKVKGVNPKCPKGYKVKR